jgi:hypothetical protein
MADGLQSTKFASPTQPNLIASDQPQLAMTVRSPIEFASNPTESAPRLASPNRPAHDPARMGFLLGPES